MATSVLIDGDWAIVDPDPDDLAATARALLDAADRVDDVRVHIGRRVGFRVPASLVDALGLIDTPSADEPEASADDAPPVVAPKGNASRADWVRFLEEQGVDYPTDSSRDELADLWKSRAE